jgi:amino acid adenylation domain-containing protein
MKSALSSQQTDSTEVDAAAEVIMLPTSLAQQRLWFIAQFDTTSPAYNLPGMAWLRGRCRPELLEQSLNLLIARHETLRTTFRAIQGQPMQLIAPELALQLKVQDLRKLAPSSREEQLENLVQQEAWKPFDLEHGPLVRALLLRLADQEAALLVTVHHIISDDRSERIFWEELTGTYDALCKDGEPHWIELPIQYADFAQWQREEFAHASMKPLLAYWRKQLENLPALRLPLDYPRPALQTTRGGTASVVLSSQLTQALRQAGQREGTTLFMTLMAVYQVLLGRHAGQDDFAVGSPISGRCRRETEPLIGFFINMLPFRAKLKGNPTFRELLKRTRQTALEAYEYQNLPFELMVEEAQAERQLNQTPVFQVAFSLLGESRQSWEAGDLQFELKPLEQGPAKFDLTLSLREQQDGLRGALIYNADLFDAQRMERMAAYFVTLCERLCAAPEAPITSHSLLPDEGEQRVLEIAHGPETAYPQETLAAQFEAWVEKQPQAIAVTGDGATVDYATLNVAANRIAHFLRSLSLAPETPVGLPADRSWQMIAGLLGIVKAGLAYVPLDLEQPAARLARMQAICGHQLDLQADYSAFPAHNPPPCGSESAIAYVIFTSGSTGEPKGVCVPQRAVTRLVCQSNYLEFRPEDGVAQAAAPTFDAAVFEIWGALLNGARLVIIPREALLSPPELGRTITSQQITIMLLTTPLFHQIAAEAPAIFRPLRYLFFGGDAADAKLVGKVFAAGKPAHLINAYGPTENGVISTIFEVAEVPENELPIGQAIANTDVFLLNPESQLVPDGVVAEICVGGAGLATGYYGQPELTAAVFIDWRGKKLYRTGDLARRRSDGNLVFIGRRDHQIKHRGFRIELAEVEAALRQIEGVDDAVAIYDQGRLFACASTALNEEALTAAARQLLPDYMLPQPLIPLLKLPLNGSGKVDRKTVLKCAQNWQPSPNREPETVREKAIAAIWSELLEIENPGLDDDFFASGGHSLLAIQLLSRIRRDLEIEITVRQLFEQPTIAGLANAVPEHKTATGAYHHAVEIQAGRAGKTPLFLVPGGGGGEIEFLVYKRLAAYIGDEQPIIGLQARGWEGAHKPHEDLQNMAQDYLAAIRAIQPHGPYLLAGECVGGVAAYEIAQLLHAAGEKIALLMLLGAEKPSARRLLQFRWHQAWENLGRVLRVHVMQPLTGHWEKLARLSPGEKFRYIRERLGPRPSTPSPGPGVFEESQDGLANYHLMEYHYPKIIMRSRPADYPGVITLLLDKESFAKFGLLGWDTVTQKIESHILPGDHLTYIREHAAEAGRQMRECLERASQS